MFGAKLSWCQIVRCQIVLVPNCPGAKLSAFIILVPNCLLYYLGAKLSGAKLSGAKLSYNLFKDLCHKWFTRKWQGHFKTTALLALVFLKPFFKMENLKMTKPCRWHAQCPMAKQRKYSFHWSCPAKPWKSHLLILWSNSGHINHLMFQRFYSLWYFASLETSLLPLWFAGAEALQISGSAFWWWRTLRF